VPGKGAAPRGQAAQAGRQADEGGAAAPAEPDPASHCRVLPVGAVRGAPPAARPRRRAAGVAGWPGLLLLLSGSAPCEEDSVPRAERGQAGMRMRMRGCYHGPRCAHAPVACPGLAPTRQNKNTAACTHRGAGWAAVCRHAAGTSTRMMRGRARGRRRRPPQPLRVGRARDPRAGPRRARRPGDAQRPAASAAGRRAGAARPRRPAARRRAAALSARGWPRPCRGLARQSSMWLMCPQSACLPGMDCVIASAMTCHRPCQLRPPAPVLQCCCAVEPGGLGLLVAAARSRSGHRASCGLRVCLSCKGPCVTGSSTCAAGCLSRQGHSGGHGAGR